MAFDAGAIEATLTLNRNPFTAGIAAARAQISEFKRRNSPIEIDIKINLQQRQLLEAEAILKRFKKEVATATARVRVDRLQFDALRRDLRAFGRSVYSARVDVDTGRATANVIAFRTLLGTLNDQTVNLNANTRGFGRAAGDGFGQGASHFQRMALLIVSFLPIIASGFTAAVGGVGALASAFIIAGLGAGAFALVAVPAFKKIKDAVAGGQAEINKLPPGLREAGNAMKGMQTEYDKLVKSNERITGIALASWFNAGTAALKTLNPLVHAAGEAFSTAGARAQTFFESAWWKQFVGWLSDAMLPATDMLFRSIFALIEIVGNLTRAFWDLGGSEIMGMITTGLEQFAHWTTTIGENKTFQAFMDAAVRSFPVVAKLIGEVVEFIFKLAIALEPLGTLIIRVLNGILDAINSLPLPVIQALALAVGAFWVAMALGAGGPVAIALGVLAGLAAAFIYLAETSDGLRTSIDNLITPIRDWFIPLADNLALIWRDRVVPAWNAAVAATRENLIPVFEYLWHMFVENVLPAISRLADTFTGTLLPAILDFWTAIQPFVAWVLKAFGEDIIYAIQLVVSTFDGAFQIIAGLLNVFTGIFTGDWTKFTEGIQQITQGFWTIIAGIFGLSLDELKAKMQKWSTEQVFTWQGMWDSIKGGASAFFTWFNDGWIKLWRDSADEAKTWGGIVAASFQHDFLDVIKTAATGFFTWFGEGWVRLWSETEREQHSWSGTITSSFQRDFIDALKNAFSSFSTWFTDGWTRMGTALKNEWNSWAGSLASAFRTMVDNARTGANSIIDELNRLIGAVNSFLSSVGVGGIPSIPRLASGGTLGSGDPGGQATGLASGGRVGGGFMTNGPIAIVGEGNPNYPEYVIPTDPKYRSRAQGLYSSLGPQLMASGGILSIPGNLIGGAQAAVDGIINGLTNSAGWKWGEIAIAVARKASSAIVAKIQAGINAVMAAIAAAAATVFGGVGPGGPAPAGGSAAMQWIIAHESGGRNIKNPVSTASGYFQMINGTWKAYGGSTPTAMQASYAEQEAVATRYVNARYGGWGGAVAYWQAHGNYDSGGILPTGTTLTTNNTGSPEAILTAHQLKALTTPAAQRGTGLTAQDVADIVSSVLGVGPGDTYNVMLPEKATVRELADTLDFKRRVVSKGRYSR